MKTQFILFFILINLTSFLIQAESVMLKPKFLFEFGKSGTGDGEFTGPKDVATDFSGRVYVLDEERVQVFTSNGIFLAKFGSVGNGPEQFTGPYALTIGRLGNIYVTDIEANCIHVFNKDFQYAMKFGSTGEKDGELYCPRQIAIGENENVYVVDWHNDRVSKFNSAGGFLTNFNFPGSDIWGVTMNPSGGWLMSGFKKEGSFIQSYDFQGTFLREILTKTENNGKQTFIPEKSVLYDLAVYQGGFYIGSLEEFNRVHLYTPTNYLTQFGAYGKNPAQFKRPSGIAVNSQRDKLYVSDHDNNRVQVFSFELITNFSPVATNGNYHSGDFTGDGYGDILVYRKTKTPTWFFDNEKEGETVSILNVGSNGLEGTLDVSLPIDWKLLNRSKLGKTLVGNSMGIFSSVVFLKNKTLKVARYWVDPLLIQNELQEEKQLPVSFKIGHVRASGDVNYDGNLDLILTKGQGVKVLVGPDYTELKDITGLPTRLPGRVRAMYHQEAQDNVLVFQKGKKAGQSYLVNSNFEATSLGAIAVTQRIRAMSGATPVTQQKRTIQMGGFTYQDPKQKHQRRLKVVGPR